MQLSPLWKIPVIFANATFIHITYTSPNPVPPRSEQDKYQRSTAYAVTPPLMQRIAPPIMKVVSDCFSAAEIASLVASERFQGSTSIPTALLKPGAIRVTTGYMWALGISAVAAMIRIACYRALGPHFTFQLSLKKDHKLVTSGPYSVVRHPGYTAASIQFAAALYTQIGPGSWFYEGGYWESTFAKIFLIFWASYMLGTIFVFMLRTVDEDKMLRKQFPEEWDRWAHRTPYRLVPFFR